MATLTRAQQQDLICRVNGDAPAAQMLRRYWLPVLLSRRSRRTRRNAGARAAARRRTSSRSATPRASSGIVDEPHVRTGSRRSRSDATKRAGCAASTTAGSSTSTARAWRCRPSRRIPHSRSRLRPRAYPVREAGGLIWTYVGPRRARAAVSGVRVDASAARSGRAVKFSQNTNYLQAAEGAIDSAHTRFLHRGSIEANEAAKRETRLTRPCAAARGRRHVLRLPLRRDAQPNEERRYGRRYVKMTRYVFPATAVTSAPARARQTRRSRRSSSRSTTTHTMHYSIWHSLDGDAASTRIATRDSTAWSRASTSTRSGTRMRKLDELVPAGPRGDEQRQLDRDPGA